MKIGVVMKALSHPIRRDIISRLRERPMTAGELAALYDVSKPTMSTHFAALRDAELLVAKRDGVSIVYRLNLTVTEEALSAMMTLLGASSAMEGEVGGAVTGKRST